QPSGRSLEPDSNVRPRGMAVLPVSGRQNSAYRSGCHKHLFPSLCKSSFRPGPGRPGLAAEYSAAPGVRGPLDELLIGHPSLSPWIPGMLGLGRISAAKSRALGTCREKITK